MLTSLSMLVLGMRGFRYYVCLGAAVGGWLGGMVLGDLMHVTAWYVAGPATLITLGLVWPISKWSAPVVIGAATGSAIGTLVANGFELGGFWLAFAVGLFGGVSLTVLAPRFAIALFTAAWGTLGLVATLGAVVRAQEGWLSPGGYLHYSTVYVIAGPIIFVVAMIVQVALEPEPLLGQEGYGR